MKDSIVNELITAMKDRLPPGQNLANFLTDTLCIGREAVYRLSLIHIFQDTPIQKVWDNDGDQILAYMRKDLVFVFNFSPTKSFTDYGFLVPKGEYEVVLNTDATRFGGFGLADDTIRHFTQFDPLYKKEKKEWLKLYIPARSAVVLRKVKVKK